MSNKELEKIFGEFKHDDKWARNAQHFVAARRVIEVVGQHGALSGCNVTLPRLPC